MIDIEKYIRRSGRDITLPAHNKEVEQELDKRFFRFGTDLRWHEKYESDDREPTFQKLFPPKQDHVYIVGKGPSLDRITKDDFNGEDLVICCNDSVNPIHEMELDNPVVMMQLDRNKTLINKYQELALLTKQAQSVSNSMNFIIFTPYEFGCTIRRITATSAICFAKFFGIRKITMMGFDACVTKETQYAKSVGYEVSGNSKRFLNHLKFIDYYTDDCVINFFMPKDRAESASYTLEQSLYNPVEHHVAVSLENQH
jgi:hypothetical protein